VRILCKLYECVLRLYTLIRRGPESDLSKILVDYYTEAQTKAQLIIDQKLNESAQLEGELLVIIPFKDRWDLTSACLRTLNEQSLPSKISTRVVLVDNGSIDLETNIGVSSASKNYTNIKIESLKADYSFNFSKLNNDAFTRYSSEATRWVLFLNNDIELNDKLIISRMMSCLESIPEVGAVGCTLLYPDRRIQHLFAAPGVKLIAAHPLKGVPYNDALSWFQKPARPVPAVTGAVMMLRAKDFEVVGMFDEALATIGQDIVLSCLVSEKLSKFNVSLKTSGVIHHESPTKKVSFSKDELRHAYDEYAEYLYSDRYHSRRFSRWSEPPAEVFVEEGHYPIYLVI
jgi:GT2 family glycosyltransferase